MFGRMIIVAFLLVTAFNVTACQAATPAEWVPGTSVATASPDLGPHLDLSGAVPCSSDDGSAPSYPCTWDPQTQGNGQGPAFVVLVFLAGGQLCPAWVPNGYLCLEQDPVTGAN